MKIQKIFFLGFLLITPYSVLSSNIGFIWGKSHLYSLTAPKGWVLDNISGKQKNLHAVFHPEGSSWAHSTTAMYANTSIKEEGKNNINELINYTLNQFKKSPNNKKTEVKNFETIKLNGKDIVIKEWLNHTTLSNNYELTAYIEESKVIVILVLTSRDKKEFTKSIDSFKELVKSYKFYSDKLEYKALSNFKLNFLIKKAKRHAKNKKGSEYEKQVTQFLGRDITQALIECQKHIKKLEDIDVIFKINKLGIVIQAFWSKNQTAKCVMKGSLLGLAFPIPPINNFYYHIQVKMDLKEKKDKSKSVFNKLMNIFSAFRIPFNWRDREDLNP